MTCVGSAAATALKFIRFALMINLLQLLVWLCLVVLPFIATPPATFTWSIFRTTSPLYLLQGYGLGSTFMLYGESLLPSDRDVLAPVDALLQLWLSWIDLKYATSIPLKAHGPPSGAAVKMHLFWKFIAGMNDHIVKKFFDPYPFLKILTVWSVTYFIQPLLTDDPQMLWQQRSLLRREVWCRPLKFWRNYAYDFHISQQPEAVLNKQHLVSRWLCNGSIYQHQQAWPVHSHCSHLSICCHHSRSVLGGHEKASGKHRSANRNLWAYLFSSIPVDMFELVYLNRPLQYDWCQRIQD